MAGLTAFAFPSQAGRVRQWKSQAEQAFCVGKSSQLAVALEREVMEKEYSLLGTPTLFKL
jgi:hypothetical protein